MTQFHELHVLVENDQVWVGFASANPNAIEHVRVYVLYEKIRSK